MVYETSVTYRHFVKAQNVTKWGCMFFKEILSHFTDISFTGITDGTEICTVGEIWRHFFRKKNVIVISELRAISNIHQ